MILKIKSITAFPTVENSLEIIYTKTSECDENIKIREGNGRYRQYYQWIILLSATGINFSKMKKEYSNGELTIVWQPEKCIHSGVCVKTLPEVYKPKEKPWIKQENAKTEELVGQIDSCPSGALSYYFNAHED